MTWHRDMKNSASVMVPVGASRLGSKKVRIVVDWRH